MILTKLSVRKKSCCDCEPIQVICQLKQWKTNKKHAAKKMTIYSSDLQGDLNQLKKKSRSQNKTSLIDRMWWKSRSNYAIGHTTDHYPFKLQFVWYMMHRDALIPIDFLNIHFSLCVILGCLSQTIWILKWVTSSVMCTEFENLR